MWARNSFPLKLIIFGELFHPPATFPLDFFFPFLSSLGLASHVSQSQPKTEDPMQEADKFGL